MDLSTPEQVCALLGATGYAAASLLALTRGAWAARPAALTAGLGLFANGLAIIARAWVARRPPFASQYEFTLVFAFAIAAILQPLLRQRNQTEDGLQPAGVELRELKVLVLSAAALLLVWVLFTPQAVRPLMPALRSGWLTFHVSLAAGAYACFVIAGGAGAAALLGPTLHEQRLARLDAIQYRLIAWGYLALTMAIITGAIWAYNAWGRYWGWDPKETWSLITWIVYSIYLHLRLQRGWSRRSCAILAVSAVGAVLFTFIGVNLLLPGLHSYR